MIGFPVDTIKVHVVFGHRVFQQLVGIPVGTNYAPLLGDLFLLHSYKAEFVQKLLQDKKKKTKISVSSNLHIDKMMFYQLAIMIFTITSI
jgi:hypothetical protein